MNDGLFPAAEVRPAEEASIVRRIEQAIKRADESSWEVADGYLELMRLGWTQQRIAARFEVSQSHVSKFASCARDYSLGNNRPPFWEAYRGVNGMDRPPAESPPPGTELNALAPTVDDLPRERNHQPNGQQADDPPGPASDTPHVHVAQNSGEQEWYTPPEYLDAARAVLGGFDLDPATSEVAQAAVRATCFYTKDDDGLTRPWQGRVWMNPPYASGLVDSFVNKLVAHYRAGDVTAAVVLVNNATETRWFRECAEAASAACFPTGRVRFLDPQGNPGAPLQGQALLYLGDAPDLFCESFARFGFCVEIKKIAQTRQ